jgi:hypothetical protein
MCAAALLWAAAVLFITRAAMWFEVVHRVEVVGTVKRSYCDIAKLTGGADTCVAAFLRGVRLRVSCSPSHVAFDFMCGRVSGLRLGDPSLACLADMNAMFV